MTRPLVLALISASVLSLLLGCSSGASSEGIENSESSEPDTSDLGASQEAEASIEDPPTPYIGDDAMFDFIVSVREEFLDAMSSPQDSGASPELLGRSTAEIKVTPPRCELIEHYGKNESDQNVSLLFGLQSGHGYGYLQGGEIASTERTELLDALSKCTEYVTSTPSDTQYSLDGGEFDLEQYRLMDFEALSDDLYRARYDVTEDSQYIDSENQCVFEGSGCRTVYKREGRQYYFFAGDSYLVLSVTVYLEVVESDYWPLQTPIDDRDRDTDQIAKDLAENFVSSANELKD
jgi:hypothetical protein